MPISPSLEENISALKAITHNSSDIVIKRADVFNNKIAVVTCEGMASGDSLSIQLFAGLKNASAEENIPPGELIRRISDFYLTGADASELTDMSDVLKRVYSGFAAIFAEGAACAAVVGVQGYSYRGIDEPSGELNVRGPREGFTEIIRVNMSQIRRRIKSPSLVFEMYSLGSRSKTDVCLCYFADKASPALIENIRRRLKSIPLSAILESGAVQPFFEGRGGRFFSECTATERPDVLCARLYEGRAAVLVDGTPFQLVLPHLFIEGFQTLDDYTQKPFYAAFMRFIRLTAYLITVFLPGMYVAAASYHAEMLPPELVLNLAAAEQTAPFSLMVECLFIHFMYEILREAGIRLPRPVGHAIGVVGGLVIGDITVSAGLIGAPMVLIVALSGLCGFVIPEMYEKTVMLRFIYIIAGGITGFFGLFAAAGAVVIKMCSLETYGVPYMAPLSPFTPLAARDMFIRADWRRLAKTDVTVEELNGADTE